MKTHKLFLLLTACLTLMGCGQPGPLYLPGTIPPIYVEPDPEPDPQSKPLPVPEKNN